MGHIKIRRPLNSALSFDTEEPIPHSNRRGSPCTRRSVSSAPRAWPGPSSRSIAPASRRGNRMALVGAAPEELEQLACTMGRGAEHLRSSVSQTIGSQLQSSPWEGGDADQFRHDWASRLNPLLLHAVEALQAADTALRKEAREQRVASDESAVSAPAGIGRFAPVDHSDATRFTDPLPSPFVDWGGWSKLLKNDSSVIGTGVTLLTLGNLAVSRP